MASVWSKTTDGPAIIRMTAGEFGYCADDLTGPRRDRPTCAARHIAMKRLREHGLSLPQIGRMLNRDHTTVLHGIRRAEAITEGRN